ncbi:hypothetical protein WA026_009087 [Henosepilachna vigintioctopunctata]|uniref:Odorant receptor n=1 Tax=Henosepilachna vigintioctopunctata TaxID=420089 RepID=A0AAW1UUV1_9CUCU
MANDLIKRSFGGNIKIMSWYGMNFVDVAVNNSVYKIYSYILYFLTTWIFPVLIVSTIFVEENVDLILLTDMMFLLPQMWILSVKIFPFLKKNVEIRAMLELIQDEHFKSELPEHKKIVERCVGECKKMFLFFIVCSIMAWVLWAGKPLYAKEKLLPMNILLPFELTKAHPLYYPIFIYVSGCGLYGATSNCSIDCLFAGLMHHVSGQIKILKHKLIQIGRKDNLSMFCEDDDPNRTKVRNECIYNELKECIDHYDKITSYIKDLEEIFTFVPFGQLSVSTVVICVSCFQVMILDPLSTNFLGMITFALTMIFQIYTYCHYGNQLYHESASIGDAVYMSDWYSFDLKSKRMIIILMERSKKPLVFKAGYLLPLSVETFVSIMRKTYSLLAVLQKQME